MKAMLSLRGPGYLRTIGVFLIAIALIAGVVGCEGEGEPVEYDLTTNSTAGGVVTAPGEGTYTYDDGTVVDLVATPDCGYAFDVWTGDTGTIDDINAAATNITMSADYSVTANFEVKPLDHFRCYWMEGPPPPVGESVQLEDQFGAFDVTVGQAVLFANPVEKVLDDVTTPISDPNNHLTFYSLDYDKGHEVTLTVEVSNQFGTYELTVAGPLWLATPTQKLEPGAHEDPECLDHFLVYQVIELSPEIGEYVDLTDQFGSDQGVGVFPAGFVANPVKKTHDSVVTDIKDPEEHLVLYWTDSTYAGTQVQVSNQFGEPQVLHAQNAELLAVPSQKISWEQPLNHFKTYWADWTEGPIPEGFPVNVQVEDQFITDWLGEPLTADVTAPHLFANPVEKCVVGELECTYIWNPNNHLTFYHIVFYDVMQMWEVTITNQFDPGVTQNLSVAGPVLLAVPTQKAEHDPPADLNHFLVYFVVDWTVLPGELQVYLSDQFTERFAWVYEPELFAIPCQKTVAGGPPTPIIGDEHLVYYRITGGEFLIEALPIDNQFGPQDLYIYEGIHVEAEDLLGVPSQKIQWTYVGPYTP